MYKLLHLLFGWDYIVWENTVASGIARVFIIPDGRVVYWRYRSIKCLDVIKKKTDVIWLTCSPAKYGL